MTEKPEQYVDWYQTTFEGSRREQLRRVQAMTVRERLEALDQLRALSDRLQTMKRHDPLKKSEPSTD